MRTTQHASPSKVSWRRVLPIFWNTPRHVSMNVTAVNCSPKSPLICDEAIVIAAAEVNPETTGNDTNSTRNPEMRKNVLNVRERH